MRPIEATVRAAIVVHRWLGVALCLLFLTWFASGMVMIYHSFPEVTPRDRLAHAEAIDASRVRIDAARAMRAFRADDRPVQARLEMLNGRPAWRINDGQDAHVVYADDSALFSPFTQEMARTVAIRWAGSSDPSPRASEVTVADQWTLEGPLRTMRPLWKFSFADGQEIYVSGITGDVVQATTARTRAWSWLGPIPHFLYFAAIRRHRDAWRYGVIALSALATLGACLGLLIGVTKFSPRARFRRSGAPAFVPYAGTKRWHQITGLTIGIAAVTWAFSGMLSLDPFPVYAPEVSEPLGWVRRALRSDFVVTSSYASLAPAAALQAAGGAPVRLELAHIIGVPTYVATFANGDTRFVPLEGLARDSIGVASSIAAVHARDRSGLLRIAVLTQYDAYYRDRERTLPLPVLLVTSDTFAGERLYVDPRTATTVGSYSPDQWSERWLYHGLHSLDLPWLYLHRPLWDIVVLTLLAGGVFLSGTSLILAWRVLRRLTIRRRSAP